MRRIACSPNQDCTRITLCMQRIVLIRLILSASKHSSCLQSCNICRKKKLLKKQAEGKKRMKSMGRVNVPQEAFMAMVSRVGLCLQ